MLLHCMGFKDDMYAWAVERYVLSHYIGCRTTTHVGRMTTCALGLYGTQEDIAMT